MFQTLFKRAEATVDQAVTSLILRALVALPFLVAAGFVTAAAAIYATRHFGEETGYVVMAVAFVVIGALLAVMVSSRRSRPPMVDAPEAQAAVGDEAGSADARLGDVDRELLLAAVTALGPLAAPMLIRLIVKNLPLLTAIAAAGFVMTRPTPANNDADVGMQAAE